MFITRFCNSFINILLLVVVIILPNMLYASDYIPRGYYVIDLKNRVEWLTCTVGSTWECNSCK